MNTINASQKESLEKTIKGIEFRLNYSLNQIVEAKELLDKDPLAALECAEKIIRYQLQYNNLDNLLYNIKKAIEHNEFGRIVGFCRNIWESYTSNIRYGEVYTLYQPGHIFIELRGRIEKAEAQRYANDCKDILDNLGVKD
jgi:hypothetical protein